MFTRRIVYDRNRLLEGAERLEKGRRFRRAIVFYRHLIAAEPRNPELHARLAPLLARARRVEESWDSFEIATLAYEEAGREEDAHALLKQAAAMLPEHVGACRRLARGEVARQSPKAALQVIWDTEQRISRSRRRRSDAILLLRDAREVEAWNPRIVLELGRLLAREGRAPEALFLLDELSRRVRGDHLRAVRFLIWRIEPSLRHGWIWLRTQKPALSGGSNRGRFSSAGLPRS